MSVSVTSQVGNRAYKLGWSDTISNGLKWSGSYLMVPFWKAEGAFQYCILPFHPGEYGQQVNKIIEIAKRIFIAVIAIPSMVISLPLVLMAYPLTGLARVLQTHDYRGVQGDYEDPETQSESTKVFHLNTCMFYGGLPYLFGGMRTADERLNDLIKHIQEEDPDLLFLCEFNRMLCSPMISALKESYSHFFADIGLNALGMENSLFVACRRPIVSEPEYIPFEKPAEGDQRAIKRGAFALETEDRWYIYTHLHPHDEEFDQDMRQQQLETIQTFIDTKTKGKACVLLGDLNIDRFSKKENYDKMIQRGTFVDHFATQHPYDFTASNFHELHLKGDDSKPTNEAIDYVLTTGAREALDIKIYDTYKAPPDQAISDHRGLVATFA